MRPSTGQKPVLFPRTLRMGILGVFVVFTSLTFLSLLAAPRTAAAVSSTINFQARLENATGSIAADGNYNVEFKLYDASSGGTLLWTEDHLNNTSTGVHVVNGYLTVNLGSVTAFGTLNWNQQLWLTMNVGNTNASCTPFSSCGPDGEMSPRIQLTAVPYAFQAGELGNGTNRATFDASGNLVFQQASTVKELSAATGTALTIQGGQATGGTNVGGNLLLQGGAGASTGASGSVIVKANTNDTTVAFQVQNAAGTTTILDADTVNTRVGIGTASPSTTLHVVSNDLTFGGALIENTDNTVHGNAFAPLYIQHDTSTVGDTSGIGFRLQNASGTAKTYGYIGAGIVGNAVGNEAGRIVFQAMNGGILQSPVAIMTAVGLSIQTGANPNYPLEVTGDTDGNAVGPLVVHSSASGASIGTALTLDATPATGGHKWSFLSTGPNATAGAGSFAFYDGTAGAYRLSIGATGNVGVGITVPTNLFQVGPQDAFGSATRTNSSTTLVGSGTGWSNAQVGDVIVFFGGYTNTVASVTDATHLTMGSSYGGTTDGSPVSFVMYKPAFNVTSAGNTYVQNASTAAFQVQNASGASLLTADTTNTAIVFGNDVTPSALTVRGGARTGTDVAGSNITFDASNGTGTGGSGDIIFRTANGVAPLAVAHDASASNVSSGKVTSLSWSHTIGGSSNRLLIVNVMTYTASVSSVTYNGTGMTNLSTLSCTAELDGDTCTDSVWYLKESSLPAAGTYTVQVNLSASDYTAAGSTSFYNVNQTTPFGSTVTATLASPNIQVSVPTTSTKQMVFDAESSQDYGAQQDSSQTLSWRQLGSGGQQGAAGYRQATGSTVTMTWAETSTFAGSPDGDSGGTETRALIGVPINPLTVSSSSADTLTDVLHLKSNGNIGINTSNPQATLDVNGNANFENGNLNVLGVGAAASSLVVSPGSNQGGSLLGDGTIYYYQVSAITATGETIPSNEVTITGTQYYSDHFTAIATAGNPTLALTTGTALGIGLYRYAVTFVTADGETGGNNQTTITTTSGNQAVNLTSIPIGPTGTTARRIYRTQVGGGSKTERFLTTVADNTTTSYADTIPDASLGSSLYFGYNTATTNTNNAILSWTPVSGATSYKIYRGTSRGGENVYFTSATNSYTDTGAAGTSGTPVADTTQRLGIGTGNPRASLDVMGNAIIQTPINSTTALDVRDSSGTSVLSVDTVNGTLNLANAGGEANVSNTELNTGTYSSPIGNWTTTGWTIGGGGTTATNTLGNTSALVYNGLTFTAGVTYQVTVDVGGSCGTSGSLTILPANGYNYSIDSSDCNDANHTFVTTANFTGGLLEFVPTSNWTGTIDYVSIVRVTPNLQPTLTVQGQELRVSSNSMFFGGGGQYYVNGEGTGENTAYGSSSLLDNVDGFSNTAIGNNTLQWNSYGFENTALGDYALNMNTDGGDNTSLGAYSLMNNAIGNFNVAVGEGALHSHESGDNNTAVGTDALNNDIGGTNNVALGYKTGYNVDGSANTFIGYQAGYQDYLGNFATTTSVQSATAIGAYAQVQANNSIVLGRVDVATNVGIGTTIPDNTFSVEPVFIDDNTNTASQSTNTITGVSTTWLSSGVQVGMRFIFADGTDAGTVTAVNSNTSLTVSTSQTVSSQHYRIHRAGFQVTSSGNAYIQNTSTTAFQVQNASGTAVLATDTTNKTVTVRSGNDTKTLSSEMYTGNFSSGWTTTGWNVSGVTTAVHNTGNTSSLVNTSVAITSGATYQVSFVLSGTCTANTEGVAVHIGGTLLISGGGFGGINCNGDTYTYIGTTVSTAGLTFTPTTNWAGTISGISIMQLTGTLNSALTIQNNAGSPNLEIRASSSTTNIFIGLNSGSNNVAATGDTAVGAYTLQNEVSGGNNAVLGYQALQNNTQGNDNVAIGLQALQANATGFINVAVGSHALTNNITGYDNTALGYSSLLGNVVGHNNTAVGEFALGNSIGYNGNYNSALGNNALYANTSGAYNSALGYSAGYKDSGNNFSTLATLQNATAIGAYAQVQASNSIVLGSVDTATKVGIGITVPSNIFSVSPLDYQTGTAVRTNGSATLAAGVSVPTASWTSAMVGDIIIFADGTINTVVGWTDASHITMGTTYGGTTDPGSGVAYRFHHTGLQVASSGFTGIGTTSPGNQLEVQSTVNTTRGITVSQYSSDTSASVLIMAKARGTPGAPSAVQLNDNLSNLAFQGYNSSAFYASAAIKVQAAENWTTSAEGSQLEFYTTHTGGTSQSEAMRINGSGFVGIGTTNPQNILDVAGGMVIGASYAGTNTAPSNGLLVQGNIGVGITTANETISLNQASGNNVVGFYTNGTVQGFVGVSNSAGGVIGGSSIGDLMLRTQSHNVLISTNGGTSSQVIIDTSGNQTFQQASTISVNSSGASLTIQAGNATSGIAAGGNLLLQATTSSGGASGKVIVKEQLNGGYFQVQNSSSVVVLQVTGSQVVIGAGSGGEATPSLLVLDSETGSSSDPTEVDGAMYYNTTLAEYRCGRDGAWENCGINPIDRGFDIEDEFMGGTTTNGQIGALGWTDTAISTDCATKSYNSIAATANRPGSYHVATAATLNTGCLVSLNTADMILAAGQTMKAAFSVSSTTNEQVRIGWYAGTTQADPTTSGLWWEAVNGTANWRYCYATGAAATCANSATAVAANTFVRLEIRLTATGSGTSAATFCINGTCSTVSSVTIGTGTAVQPGYTCTDTSVATAIGCDIDYYQLRGVASSAR